MPVPNVTPRRFAPAKLVQLRERRGWRQWEAAIKADIPLDTYRQYENGRVRPSLERLAALASALDVPMDDLFQGTRT
jgi:DNA-binding XRE family transcriptional regulator